MKFILIPVAGLVAVVLLFVGIHLFSNPTGHLSPLERGVLWLRYSQEKDGAWRGKEVAVLRPGPATTAFVLYALSRLPPPMVERYRDSLDQAAAYLRSRISAEGLVGVESSGLDYPTYATSLAILGFTAVKPDNFAVDVAKMADALKRGQLDESEGWSPDDPEYGGWAFGGAPQPKPYAHRLDISTTRFALEALAAAGVAKTDPAWSRARRFVERCQNPDGGFRFTTIEGQDKADGRSYGTATADGLICLRLAEGPPERRAAAEAWMREHFTIERCPGFPADHPRPWADGLLGYWLAAAARVTGPVGHERIRTALAARQREDGSWVNASDLMLENEPLLATALAVLALADSEPPPIGP
jgi:squalene-hopene/tetraprenyl-beta-curcumene cyclase